MFGNEGKLIFEREITVPSAMLNSAFVHFNRRGLVRAFFLLLLALIFFPLSRAMRRSTSRAGLENLFSSLDTTGVLFIVGAMALLTALILLITNKTSARNFARKSNEQGEQRYRFRLYDEYVAFKSLDREFTPMAVSDYRGEEASVSGKASKMVAKQCQSEEIEDNEFLAEIEKLDGEICLELTDSELKVYEFTDSFILFLNDMFYVVPGLSDTDAELFRDALNENGTKFVCKKRA